MDAGMCEKEYVFVLILYIPNTVEFMGTFLHLVFDLYLVVGKHFLTTLTTILKRFWKIRTLLNKIVDKIFDTIFCDKYFKSIFDKLNGIFSCICVHIFLRSTP